MKFVVLLIFSMLCCTAQQPQLSIDNFQWLENDNVFVFSGKTSLPKNCKIKIIVSCGQHTVRSQLMTVKGTQWSHYMHFPENYLLPGEYSLQIKVMSHSVSDHGAYQKKYFHKNHLRDKIDQKLRAELFGFLDDARAILDSLVVNSYYIMWQIPQRERRDAWQSLVQKIQINEKQKLVKQCGEKAVIHPYLFSLQKIRIVFRQLQKLQKIFADKIANGDENFPFFLVQNIEKNAVASLKELKTKRLWTYALSCAKERYTLDKKIYRSSSRFKLFLPRLPDKIETGDKNSALRVIFYYKNMQCSVYMLSLNKFSRDAQIQALKVISAYVWKWHITDVRMSLIRMRRKAKKIYRLSLRQSQEDKYHGAIAIPGDKGRLFLITVKTNKALEEVANNFLQKLAESFRG